MGEYPSYSVDGVQESVLGKDLRERSARGTLTGIPGGPKPAPTDLASTGCGLSLSRRKLRLDRFEPFTHLRDLLASVGRRIDQLLEAMHELRSERPANLGK